MKECCLESEKLKRNDVRESLKSLYCSANSCLSLCPPHDQLPSFLVLCETTITREGNMAIVINQVIDKENQQLIMEKTEHYAGKEKQPKGYQFWEL